MHLTAHNTSDKALPFSIGFHPYFAASKLENVHFDINAATCSENAKGEQPAAPEKITLTRKEGADNSVRLLTGVQFHMTLTDSGNGHKVTVDADETFTNGVRWQQDAESFVCMEPWNGWANSVNEDGKHEVLEPDEAMTSEPYALAFAKGSDLVDQVNQALSQLLQDGTVEQIFQEYDTAYVPPLS